MVQKAFGNEIQKGLWHMLNKFAKRGGEKKKQIFFGKDQSGWCLTLSIPFRLFHPQNGTVPRWKHTQTTWVNNRLLLAILEMEGSFFLSLLSLAFLAFLWPLLIDCENLILMLLVEASIRGKEGRGLLINGKEPQIGFDFESAYSRWW